MLRKLLVFIFAIISLGVVSVAANDTDIGVRWLVEPTWEFDIVVNFRGGMAAVEVFHEGWMHKLGYVNNMGEMVIPMEYIHDEGHYFYRGAPHFGYGIAGIFCMARDYSAAFFDATGRQLTDFEFADALDFSEGLAVAGRRTEDYGSRWGFVDTDANVAIPFEFSSARSFSEGLAAVHNGSYWGFIDRNGNLAIPFQFRDVSYFRDGMAAVAHDFRWWGIIDRTGNLVVPFQIEMYWYDHSHLTAPATPIFQEGRAAVWELDWGESEQTTYLWHDTTRTIGFVDRAGNQIVPFIYNHARNFSEGLAAVAITDIERLTRWGFIDLYGNEIVPLIYTSAYCFSGGLAAVRCRESDRWGFIDTNGSEVVPFRYTAARSFVNGFAAVRCEQGKWGFIDKTGYEIVPPAHTWVGDFAHGLATVGTATVERFWLGTWIDGGGRFGVVDMQGNIVVPIEFDEIRSFSEGLAWARMGNYWGILQIVTGEDVAGLEPLYIPARAYVHEEEYTPESEYIPDEPEYVPEPEHIPDEPEYVPEPEYTPGEEDPQEPEHIPEPEHTPAITSLPPSRNTTRILTIVFTLLAAGIGRTGIYLHKKGAKTADKPNDIV